MAGRQLRSTETMNVRRVATGMYQLSSIRPQYAAPRAADRRGDTTNQRESAAANTSERVTPEQR